MLQEREARPDGTPRKPIRVRAGYVDTDLAPKYSAAARHRVGGIVGMDAEPEKKRPPKRKKANNKANDQANKDGVDALVAQTAGLSLGTPKGAQKKKGEPPSAGKGAQPTPKAKAARQAPAAAAAHTNAEAGAEGGAAQDEQKRLRALNKKLRQIHDLQESLEEGKELTPEQHKKLQTKAKIEEEIALLQGNKK